MQVPRAHAALATRDEREHAKLEIHFGAGDEAREFVIREDRALLSHGADLRNANRCYGVLLDQFVGVGSPEHARERSVDMRDRGALEPARERLIDDAADVHGANVAQRDPPDRLERVELEATALLV